MDWSPPLSAFVRPVYQMLPKAWRLRACSSGIRHPASGIRPLRPAAGLSCAHRAATRMSGTLDHVLRKLKSKLRNGQSMYTAHVRLIFASVQQKYEFRVVNE
jgi:hypothetical protein